MEKMAVGRFDRLRLLGNSLLRKKQDRLVICLWHEFYKPPYGGGNQFMLAIKEAFERRGCLVVCNLFSPQVDVHLCNSAWFDVAQFEKMSEKYQIKMIHRIDGPVSIYRGDGLEEDKKIHGLNASFATATVYQSKYCLEESRKLGFFAVNPTIITNSVNNTIFHAKNRVPFTSNRKVKIISAAWSDNPLKGGPLFKWLDENLDWNRYEYTFVGRIQQQLKNIKHIPPQPSERLADLLRQHDVFLSASQHEPCSNALLEALSCGLPAVYRNSGGNPELVGGGGLPFTDETDVLGQLDRVVENYKSYQQAIDRPSIDTIADQYLQLAGRIAGKNIESSTGGRG